MQRGRWRRVVATRCTSKGGAAAERVAGLPFGGGTATPRAEVGLAGAEAGLLSRSGKVGAVDVLDTPQFRRYSDPFAAGAKKAAAKTHVRSVAGRAGAVRRGPTMRAARGAADGPSTVTDG